MKEIKEQHIPKTIKEYTTWQVSRRSFIKNSIALGVFTQVGFLQSCGNDTFRNDSILNEKQHNIVIAVQNILFPKDKNGPGAIDVNADKYLIWVLSDKRIDPDENQYIINGLKWIDETSEEENNTAFLKLSKRKQVQLINSVSEKSWGESWLSVMLTLIFEAMISDPIYGFNKDEVGRKWLEHVAGSPKPTKENRYDEIFNRGLITN